MITKEHAQEVVGMKVVDPDGDKIGSIDTIYLDERTDEPEFALVNTGLLGTRSSLMPLRDAQLEADTVRVPYSKGQVKAAPDIEADERIDEREEGELYRHYGLQPGREEARRPQAEAPTGRDVSGPTTDDAMTRSEEEMHVGTQQRATGKARLRKHVVTEHVTQTVPVQREEVRVEREPITDANAGQAMEGPDISDEEHEVTLMEEEPVVEKRTVPKERVRLDKDVVTEEQRVEGDVRREEIDVEDDERR
jgi:uncharacterized protein (TIGR02271 family)